MSHMHYDSYLNLFRMYSDDSLDEYDADNVEYLNEFDDSPLGRFSNCSLIGRSRFDLRRAPSSAISLKTQ